MSQFYGFLLGQGIHDRSWDAQRVNVFMLPKSLHVSQRPSFGFVKHLKHLVHLGQGIPRRGTAMHVCITWHCAQLAPPNPLRCPEGPVGLGCRQRSTHFTNGAMTEVGVGHDIQAPCMFAVDGVGDLLSDTVGSQR